MPKSLHHSVRYDGQIRIRLTETMQAEVKRLAKQRGVSISELARQLLRAELDKSK